MTTDISRQMTEEDIWLENYKREELKLDELRDKCITKKCISDAYLTQYNKVVKLINDPKYGHFFMSWRVSFRNQYHPYALMGAKMVEWFDYKIDVVKQMEAHRRIKC